MSSTATPFEVKYKGKLYRLRTAGGLGATGANDFPIIKKKNPTDVRELRYSGGHFFLEVNLLWGFSSAVNVNLPPTPLDEEGAKLAFAALSRDGGTLSAEYKQLIADGTAPGPVAEINELSARGEQKQLTADTKRVATLLRWEGEQMLRVPPDEAVARVTFRSCFPRFSVGEIPYANAPRALVEKFSQDMHVELMQMFPGAIIDTQVTDENDAHCGHPIVLNKQNVPVKGYKAQINTLAMDLWRDHYRKYTQG